MHRHGVDVLPNVRLRAFGEAGWAEALRQCAVIVTATEYGGIVVAPALAGGTAGAFKGLRAARAGFVRHGF